MNRPSPDDMKDIIMSELREEIKTTRARVAIWTSIWVWLWMIVWLFIWYNL